jgi:hypothetical protein
VINFGIDIHFYPETFCAQTRPAFYRAGREEGILKLLFLGRDLFLELTHLNRKTGR